MKVRDVMVGEVKTCSTNDDLARAAQIMWENDCGVVPVVEADEYVVGIITDRDACMAAYTQGLPLSSIRVGDVMSRQVKVVRPDEDAAAASSTMRALRVRRVPVVNALGRIVGIVSLSDLARRASKDKAGPAKSLNQDNIAETLALVCQPWSAKAELAAPPSATPAAKETASLRPQRAR
jgi:CBS domain-containing protein